MVERIVHQLAQANENLTGNSKVKEQLCMHEVQSSVTLNE